MTEFKFALGSEVKDLITGFSGVIVARTQWLYNCNVYRVQPKDLKEGAIREAGQFDEPQLELVQAPVVQERRTTGGPDRPVARTNRV